jgi:hypothetical protein
MVTAAQSGSPTPGHILQIGFSFWACKMYPFWSHLTEALRTGRPQNEARDSSLSLFEALYAEPARLKEFLRAMTGLSRGANQAIARQFPWSKYRTFADVGTAHGDLAVQIAAHNTHLHGFGFDLPEIAPIFEEYARECGVSERLRFPNCATRGRATHVQPAEPLPSPARSRARWSVHGRDPSRASGGSACPGFPGPSRTATEID